MEISAGQVVVAFVRLASSLQCFGGAVDGKAVSNKIRSFPLEEGEEIWPPLPASNFRVPMRNALALVVAPNCGELWRGWCDDLMMLLFVNIQLI
jgi:hypothetical protein